MPEGMELLSLQLPGREERYSEPHITSMAVLVNKLAELVVPYAHRPYVLFGHSMGAIIGYELIDELRRRDIRQPDLFIPSGRQAPHFKQEKEEIHRLSDEEFCREFLRENFTHRLAAVMDDIELRNLFLPQLRADMQLVETCAPKQIPPFSCPIVAFGGSDGTDVGEEELKGWSAQTNAEFRSYRFPGGHFFIEESESLMLPVLRNELLAVMNLHQGVHP